MHVHEFITGLAEGYNSLVEERGIKLLVVNDNVSPLLALF